MDISNRPFRPYVVDSEYLIEEDLIKFEKAVLKTYARCSKDKFPILDSDHFEPIFDVVDHSLIERAKAEAEHNDDDYDEDFIDDLVDDFKTSRAAFIQDDLTRALYLVMDYYNLFEVEVHEKIIKRERFLYYVPYRCPLQEVW